MTDSMNRHKGHPTWHSALSTVALFGRVQRGLTSTAVLCHQRVDRVDCSRSTANRLTVEPWQWSVRETNCP